MGSAAGAQQPLVAGPQHEEPARAMAPYFSRTVVRMSSWVMGISRYQVERRAGCRPQQDDLVAAVDPAQEVPAGAAGSLAPTNRRASSKTLRAGTWRTLSAIRMATRDLRVGQPGYPCLGNVVLDARYTVAADGGTESSEFFVARGQGFTHGMISEVGKVVRQWQRWKSGRSNPGPRNRSAARS